MNEHAAASRHDAPGPEPSEGEGAGASPTSRKAQILARLERLGEQGVEQLAEVFAVSAMTIRRDLQELAEAGRVIRTHGGASPAARVSFEFRFLERSREQAPAKAQIATVASGLVRPGQSLLLDSSTTTLAVARRLKTIGWTGTIITTSLPIASELFGVDTVETILLGGTLQKDSPDLMGGITDQNLESLRADVAFIGADAVDRQGRIYNRSTSLGRMLRRMQQSARRTYAVADHSKLGTEALMRFGTLSEWAGLITDRAADAGVLRVLRRHGVNVLQPEGGRGK